MIPVRCQSIKSVIYTRTTEKPCILNDFRTFTFCRSWKNSTPWGRFGAEKILTIQNRATSGCKELRNSGFLWGRAAKNICAMQSVLHGAFLLICTRTTERTVRLISCAVLSLFRNFDFFLILRNRWDIVHYKNTKRNSTKT